MSGHINYQTISQGGKPAFVVIPYNEFVKMHPEIREESEGHIPHEVVQLMVKNDISRIRAWREYLGFTQKEVAKEMGISQAALSQIEAVGSKPRKITLKKIAEIFKCGVDELT